MEREGGGRCGEGSMEVGVWRGREGGRSVGWRSVEREGGRSVGWRSVEREGGRSVGWRSVEREGMWRQKEEGDVEREEGRGRSVEREGREECGEAMVRINTISC